ncbi:MAG: four helix bundle protein [Bacteroidota bacterium]|nr:four helix bundle protein [Bacteroidota bacterium]
MSESNKKYDLEERLILRSGTSPAFNYGEAQVAESRSDFIHKIKICLKELKETHVALQIVQRKPLVKDFTEVNKAIAECIELISIFVKSIETARKNKSSKNT